MLQVLGLGFASRRLQQVSGRIRPTTVLSVYALGAVYGLAGFCAGPILGSVLTVAAVSGNPFYGGLLLAVYALGMAVPLFLLALLWERFDLGHRRWLRGRELALGPLRLHTNSLLSGGFFVLLGALFLRYDGTSALPGPLDVDSTFAVERWVSRWGSAVPDAALLLVLAASALVGTALWAARTRARTGTRAGAEAPGGGGHDPGRRWGGEAASRTAEEAPAEPRTGD